MAIGKGLFDFLRQPNVLGGPATNNDVAKRNGLSNRYNQYFQSHENLPFEIFYSDKKGVYFYHFQMSSSNDEVIYDVVIEFLSRDPLVQKEATLQNYDFKVYCNSPGFAFTYAYVFNKRKLLIPILRDKYDERTLNDKPERNNPTSALGYDFTLYLAMRYLQLNSYLLNKSEIRVKGKPLSKFRYQEIATAIEALDTRSGADKNAFKKLSLETKRTMRKLVSPVKKTLDRLGSGIKKLAPSTKKTARIKPKRNTTSLVKKAKISKLVKPRRKH